MLNNLTCKKPAGKKDYVNVLKSSWPNQGGNEHEIYMLFHTVQYIRYSSSQVSLTFQKKKKSNIISSLVGLRTFQYPDSFYLIARHMVQRVRCLRGKCF